MECGVFSAAFAEGFSPTKIRQVVVLAAKCKPGLASRAKALAKSGAKAPPSY